MPAISVVSSVLEKAVTLCKELTGGSFEGRNGKYACIRLTNPEIDHPIGDLNL